MKNWIENASVVVTGASSGIGKEISRILIRDYNCKVIGVARNEQNLLRFKEEIEEECKKSSKFIPLKGDVAKQESWKEIFEVAKQNNVQIVVNNAGTMLPFLKVCNIKEEDLDRILKTNFYSIFYCFKAFDEYLKSKRNCGIVNITSSSSICLIPGQSVYSASKSASTKLSLIASSEVKNQYFVGTYLPGFTDTNIFFSSDNNQDVIVKKGSEKIIEKLSAKPEKVAKKIVKFAIKKKRYKIMGRDSKALKFMNNVLKTKSGDLLLNIFKDSKNKTFKDLFD